MNVHKRKQGYALVTVMSIMAVLTLSFAMIMRSGSQSAYMGDLLIDRTKATSYAEAGIEYAYAILRDNYDASDSLSNFLVSTNVSQIVSNSVTTQYEDGTYTLTLTPINSKQYTIINSVGKCGNSTVEVEALTEDTNFETGSAYDNAIFGGGGGAKVSKISGGVVLDSDGDLQTIFINGDLDLKGGSTVDANVSVTGEVGFGTPSGTLKEGEPHMAMPSIEEQYEWTFSDFQTYAAANGQVATTVNGKYVLASGDSKTPAGGVLYVDGDVVIKGTFNGTIICTGSVDIQAGGSITGTSSGGSDALPIAVATQTGPIEYGTTADCYGLFYAGTGDFKMTAANANLEGQIVVNGIVETTGGSSITFNGNGEDEDLAANPVIAGWQK